MKNLSPVVWWEGMHLGPHHFQAQIRYFEDSIQACLGMLWPHGCGFVSWAPDVEALKNGTLNLLHASGVMPDGMPFNMPASDALPEPRQFAKLFPPDRYTLPVFLTLPVRKQNGINCALDLANGSAAESTRFVAESQPLRDETTGTDEKLVGLGRKNFHLLLEAELTPDLVTLPVARIMRSGSGEYIPDPDFIPPCLQIAASPRLMYLLGRLIDVMRAKADSMISSVSAKDPMQFASREVATFWFLHAINASLGPLQHLYASKRGHPEELFLEMQRLAGGLCTFTLDSHPRSLPRYDHMQPDVCFAGLDKIVRDYLELIIPTSSLQIDLAKAAECFYGGGITDERCVGKATWLLGIRSQMGLVDLMTKAPQLIKICSERFIGDLVQRQMPGLALTHVPVPPAAIAQRAEMQYFAIDRVGRIWDHIVLTRRIGIYIPEEIPDPELELSVILE